MAAAKVFDTAELLEAILLELPMRKIFIVKAVSKSWDQAISSSIKLQRVMFLSPKDVMQRLPEASKESLPGYEGLWGLPVLAGGPFTALPLSPSFENQKYCSDYMCWNHRQVPALTDVDLHQSGEYSAHSFALKYDGKYDIVLPQACRSLHICQPPVAAVLLSGFYGLPKAKLVYDRGGVTLGLLADTFRQVVMSGEIEIGGACTRPQVGFLVKYSDISCEMLEAEIREMKRADLHSQLSANITSARRGGKETRKRLSEACMEIKEVLGRMDAEDKLKEG